NVVADQSGAPSSAALLADVTAHLLRQHRVREEGFPVALYHVTAGGETNWHQYACHVIEYARAAGSHLRVPPEAIHPIPTSEYPTPARGRRTSSLSPRKFQATFGLGLPVWQAVENTILDR